LPLVTRLLSSWKVRREREQQEAQRLREQSPAGQEQAAKPRSDSHLFTIDGKSVDTAIKPEESPIVQDESDESNCGNFSILSKSELANPDRQCPLCLAPCGLNEESGGTCVTECGHVFCWSCIEEWAAEKVCLKQASCTASSLNLIDLLCHLFLQMECPLCRQALRLERLTPLYNL